MKDSRREQTQEDSEAALAATWPRALIADGRAEPLTTWWTERLRDSEAKGQPPLARHAASPAVAQALFEARRARRMVRGLESAEERLAAQEAGLRRSPATQAPAGQRRVSRLLVVSADGSPRFYRQVLRLRDRYASRLEALVLECDETRLGEALFGPGQVTRAVLLDHKEAVIWLLESLDPLVDETRSP